jgi:hypothetical protein
MEYYKVFVDGVTGEETRVPLVGEELQAHITATEAAKAEKYKFQRAAEYPPMEDYLDGIVKNDHAQITKYIADCFAVKAKYPKPQ